MGDERGGAWKRDEFHGGQERPDAGVDGHGRGFVECDGERERGDFRADVFRVGERGAGDKLWRRHMERKQRAGIGGRGGEL